MIKREDAQNFYVRYICHDKNHQTNTHIHLMGQLYLLKSGIISCYAKDKRWLITNCCIGWIPAMTKHNATSWGKIRGWNLYLPQSWCHSLPKHTCLLQYNELISALIARIVTFSDIRKFTEAQKRIIQVLIDEIKQCQSINSLLLPFPTDPRLINITQAIWHDPTNTRTQAEWANWAGISVRSLSRHFMYETGMTFSRWKQLAKLMISLEKLTKSWTINEIAYSLGFSDASAYIASFKSIYGISPKQYVINMNETE